VPAPNTVTSVGISKKPQPRSMEGVSPCSAQSYRPAQTPVCPVCQEPPWLAQSSAVGISMLVRSPPCTVSAYAVRNSTPSQTREVLVCTPPLAGGSARRPTPRSQPPCVTDLAPSLALVRSGFFLPAETVVLACGPVRPERAGYRYGGIHAAGFHYSRISTASPS